jgi:hypothetical protein
MMSQQEIGINQQVFIGISGEVFSSNFGMYFTEFTHRIFQDTMSPTGIVFFGSSFYPTNISSFFRDCLRRNQYANVLLLDHALPKSLDFMMTKATFFLRDDIYRGMWLSNEVVKNLPEEAFPPISHQSWLYLNLKNYLSLNLKVNYHDEDVDVIL